MRIETYRENVARTWSKQYTEKENVIERGRANESQQKQTPKLADKVARKSCKRKERDNAKCSIVCVKRSTNIHIFNGAKRSGVQN